MDGVETFLTRIGLSKYHEIFQTKGFDSEDGIPYLLAEDLDAMYIENTSDREKILQAALNYQPSIEYILYDWLRSKGLEHYFVSFIQSELIDLVDIGHLNLPDEELYDELEITLPGHKRRFERAVHSLRKKHTSKLPSFVTSSRSIQPTKDNDVPPSATSETELPVAYGRWGKPKCLADAKYDFLMLDATVISTNDSSDRVHIEFMVDSGSDVVTLRQEVLDTMDLELIGPINSKGVHGSKVKNLYKAYILIGNQYVEIEVMGESYDSIGSRVIRHFRHYINGSHHIWLKGDFVDPTMNCIEKTFMSDKLKAAKAESSITDNEKEADSIVDDISDKIEDSIEMDKVESLVQKDSVPKLPNGIDKLSPSVEINKCNVPTSDINDTAEDGIRDSNGQVTENNVDEPDRISVKGGGILDVRPLINANRKRHASNITGFDPSEAYESLAKKRKCVHSLINGKDKVDNHLERTVKVVGEDTCETLRVVLNQRTVYYRSEMNDLDIIG
ncbi:hypothetical protein ACF0H5_006151 [Mactra antiquata]